MAAVAKKADEQKYWVPPGPIQFLGNASYEGAPSSHDKARIGIVNNEYLALLFPVNANVAAILKVPSDKRTPSQNYLLQQHLMEPLDDSVHEPFMASLAGHFDDPYEAVREEWRVFKGYSTPADSSDPFLRIYAFAPPSNWYRPHSDYILPLLTNLRENGECLLLEFFVDGGSGEA